VTDLSFPAYLYEKYTANSDNLEEGLFKGKILLQVCHNRLPQMALILLFSFSELQSCLYVALVSKGR